MKKFILLGLSISSGVLFTLRASAQEIKPKRCSTMETLNEQLKDPAFKAYFYAYQKKITENYYKNPNARITATKDTIPVVVHIILPDTTQVTDAICQNQLNILNADYHATNADSTRIPAAFKPLWGGIELTFMLAKTAPDGSITTGIERRVNNISFTQFNYNNAKHFSTGGMDAWDPCKYLNMWVVQFADGTLGISTFPGTIPANENGYLCDYRAWGSGAAYLYPDFNKGRTATHEIGHYWNLLHIWGDDGNSCTGVDFPANLSAWDDTPNQASETSGNPDPSGTGTVKTDACSPSPPGIMYQNFMDYTDDIAMVMFTKGQIQILDQVLHSAPDRSCLLNSNTYLPPVLHPIDAAISSINLPFAGQQICGSTVSPEVVFRNLGSTTITSATITVTVDGTPFPSFSWTGSLATLDAVTLMLHPVTGLTTGLHNITVCATNINGGATDANTANNCQTNNFTAVAAASLPIAEGFESITFPPAGWSIIQSPADATTWVRTTAAANTGTASAGIDHFNYSPAEQQLDYLRSPLINFPATLDTALVSFDYAYRTYSTTDADTLEVVVSADCGATWTSVWKRGGTQLATVAGTQTSAFIPTASQWSSAKINISSFIGSNVYVALRAKNGFGQMLYADNINIYGITLSDYDISMADIIDPFKDICDPATTPKVRVANRGKITITSLKIGFSLDNAAPVITTLSGTNILKGQDTVFTFPDFNGLAAGIHSLKFWTADPNGNADQNTLNDTVSLTFRVLTPTAPPLVESFQSLTFPPPNWDITQFPPDAITWARTAAGAGRATHDSVSAYMHNFAYSNMGSIDDLIAPALRFSSSDSVWLKFDLAANTRSYPGITSVDIDTLKVMVSLDCGRTYSAVYAKSGIQLQTVNPNMGMMNEFRPAGRHQWRTDSVNLTSLMKNGATVRLAFRNVNHYENNIFIDNVNFYLETLPKRLKNEGYLIAPNPFREKFAIQHYLPPTKLRALTVFDAMGRQMYSRYFNGNADSYLEVNMAAMAAGIYTVKLTYDDKVISQRIIKGY